MRYQNKSRFKVLSAQWRFITVTPHERNGVWNHRKRHSLFNRLFTRTSKIISSSLALTKGQWRRKCFHVISSSCFQYSKHYGLNIEAGILQATYTNVFYEQSQMLYFDHNFTACCSTDNEWITIKGTSLSQNWQTITYVLMEKLTVA